MEGGNLPEANGKDKAPTPDDLALELWCSMAEAEQRCGSRQRFINLTSYLEARQRDLSRGPTKR